MDWKETDRTVEEILKEALEKLPGLCPSWTNYNASDPGITILEILSWLKEIQDFHMMQQGNAHREKYLKLLGGKRKRSLPGQAWVTIDEKEFRIHKGTRLYAEEVCFEAPKRQTTAEHIFAGFRCGKEETPLLGDWMAEGRGVAVHPFGRNPEKGSVFTVMLKRTLKIRRDYVLYLGFGGPFRERLLPVEDEAFDSHGFYPYGEFKLEYTSGKRVVEALVKEDGTRGFLEDGGIRFQLGYPMDEETPELRFVLERSEFLLPPFLIRISLAKVFVWQKETIKAPISFMGNGLPSQTFELGEPWLSGEHFVLEAESAVEPGQMEVWQQVEDFDLSAPWDKHYTLKEGILRFGDCLHGLSPEGRIMVTHYERTLGSHGNLKAGAITVMEGHSVSVTNEEPVTGGVSEETTEEALARRQQEVFAPFRAVTCEDYEMLVRKLPGLAVEDCHAYVEDKALHQVTLAVRPCSLDGKGRLNEACRKNLFRYLEERRLAGTRIRLLSPEYIPFAVTCEAVVRENPGEVRKELERIIGLWAKGLGFGARMRTSSLFADLEDLDSVRSIESLYLEFGSRIRQNGEGEAWLPPNGIPFLTKADLFLTEQMG